MTGSIKRLTVEDRTRKPVRRIHKGNKRKGLTGKENIGHRREEIKNILEKDDYTAWWDV